MTKVTYSDPHVNVEYVEFERRVKEMRKQTQKTAEKPVMEAGDCQHHWLIDPAAGPVSLGVCKHCGRTKEFRNSLSDWAPDLRWQDRSAAPEDELSLELRGELN